MDIQPCCCALPWPSCHLDITESHLFMLSFFNVISFSKCPFITMYHSLGFRQLLVIGREDKPDWKLFMSFLFFFLLSHDDDFSSCAFPGTLLISVVIGLYYAFIKTQKTNMDLLVGGRKMAIVPSSLSLLASYMSAILILGEFLRALSNIQMCAKTRDFLRQKNFF